MAVMRDMEVIWDDLLQAFHNTDENLVYFLDRDTGEVFFVPLEYHDEEFWREVDARPDRYIHIPGFDYEQERLLLYDFIKGLSDDNLKRIMEKTFAGSAPPYGRMNEILSFYPEDGERLEVLKEEMISDRIRRWLEEHDMFSGDIEQF